MSMGGGQRAATAAQHRHDLNVWEANTQAMRDTHRHVTSAYNLSQSNARDLVTIQNQRATAARAHQIAIADQDYATSLTAYNASLRARNQQRNFNDLAQEIGLRDASNSQWDRVTSLNHQINGLNLSQSQLSDRAALDRRAAQAGIDFAQRGSAIGTAQLRGQRNLARSRSDIQRDQLRRGLEIAGGRVGVTRRQVNQQLNSARAGGAIQRLDVSQQYRNAAEQAGLQARTLTLALRKTREEATHQGQENRLKALRNTGTLAATGQTGRSARKNTQAVMAQSSRANSILTGMLSVADAEHGLNMDRVGQVLNNARASGQINLAAIANRINQAAIEADIGLDSADIDRTQANITYQLGVRTNAVDIQQSDLNMDTGLRRNALELSQAQFQGRLGRDRAAMTIDQGAATTNLGLQQVADSRISADRQHQSDIRRVNQSYWGAQMAADARVAARPVRPVNPPVAIATPLPRTQPPQPLPSAETIASTRPPRGASGSSLAGFLQIATAAVGMMRMSDDRLKRSYNRVGTSPSGVPVYTFNYIQDGDHGPTYMGTSAQDLIAMGRSDAVGTSEKDGFYYVDYSKLDVEFEKVT